MSSVRVVGSAAPRMKASRTRRGVFQRRGDQQGLVIVYFAMTMLLGVPESRATLARLKR